VCGDEGGEEVADADERFRERGKRNEVERVGRVGFARDDGGDEEMDDGGRERDEMMTPLEPISINFFNTLLSEAPSVILISVRTSASNQFGVMMSEYGNRSLYIGTTSSET